ncbi:MAG: hypothetical protein QXU32_01170 [Nitrososphaerales archaeon]
MKFKQELLLGGALFSWLMVFIAWRFAYSLEIIVDWAILALALSFIYGLLLYRNNARRSMQNPEAMR